MNHSISHFSNEEITFLGNQFNITNSNYFDNILFDNIENEDCKKLLNEYKNCTSMNGTENCENKWDEFTQFYWTTQFSGFERYQISIDKNLNFSTFFYC